MVLLLLLLFLYHTQYSEIISIDTETKYLSGNIYEATLILVWNAEWRDLGY